MFRSRRGALLVLGGAAYLAISAYHVATTHAHVIPPEKLHRVAESYRRSSFVLNLNPILWDLVRKDCEPIAQALEKVDPVAAAAWREEVRSVIAGITAPPKEGEAAPGPNERKRAARAVFESSTRAVARILSWHLERTGKALPEIATAHTASREAGQIWAAFELEIRSTDPTAFRALGTRWLEMATALGSPGIARIGAVPVDVPAFRAAADAIAAYIAATYGPGYSAPERGALAPLPLRSPTFDPEASVPVRLPPGSDINKQVPRPRQILNLVARGVDESETALIAVGDMGFDSAFVFGEPARSLQISCNTCHNKSITNPIFVIPGLSARPGGMDVSNGFFASHANNGHFDPLDIPDLRGIRFTGPYGRNGRSASLRDFTRNVIVNEFNGPEPDPVLLDGMVAYQMEFDFLPNPALGADGRLSEKAPEAARRGETIFQRPFAGLAGRSCASCHVPSTHFLDRQSHDIGSGAGAEPHSRDGAFDTPTLLGIKHTPPYFHDGSQPTIRSVVEWFDRTATLGLSANERDDLTAYVETVGDGVDAREDTPYYLDSELEEFGFFLSAYEFLVGKGKPELMNVTFETIAGEIRNHMWELRDPQHQPVMEQMAGLMDEALAANRCGDRAAVDAKVAAWRNLYAENVDVLK